MIRGAAQAGARVLGGAQHGGGERGLVLEEEGGVEQAGLAGVQGREAGVATSRTKGTPPRPRTWWISPPARACSSIGCSARAFS